MSRNHVAVACLPLLALSLASGCATYSTRRAALVPPVQPPMRSGAVLETMGELSVNAPGLASLGDPEASKGEEPGIELPGMRLGASGRLSVGRGFDLGLYFENGRAEGSRPIAADQPAVDNGDVRGWGLGVTQATRIPDSDVTIAFTADLLYYEMPYVEYRTCVENCLGVPFTQVEYGHDGEMVMAFGVLPSWKSGPIRLVGGLSARNQPTIERGGVEGELDFSEDVSFGRFNWMVSAGAEYSLGNFKALALVYVPFAEEPIDFPATFGFALSYGFGKPRQPAAQAPVPPPAPAPAPPPPYVPATERGGSVEGSSATR